MAPKERQTIEIEKLTETSYFRSIKQLPFIARTFLGRHCRQLTNQRTFSRWSESNLSGLVLSQVAWKPLPDPDVPVTFRESDSVPKINSILLKNMRTLLHLFADLLHSSKKQPYSFQAIPHSLSKNLGVGGAPFLGPRSRSWFSFAFMLPPFQTNISSSFCPWPLAAPQRCGGGTPFFWTAATTKISCPSPSR